MEKYESFVETFKQLTDTVDAMSKAHTREEVDKLEMNTRGLMQTLTVKFPYVHAAIHDHASRCRADIFARDAKATLGE